MRSNAMDGAGGVGTDQGACRRAPVALVFLRPWPCSMVPGGSNPRSTTQPNGMRGSARLEPVTLMASSSACRISAIAQARATLV